MNMKDGLSVALNQFSGLFHIETVTVTVAKQNGNAYITAPDVDGYTFLIWFNAATDGWVGGAYNSTPIFQQGRVWTLPNNPTSGTGNVTCCALYMKNGTTKA